MALASDVMDEAAAMCGDRNKTLYTQDKLLPLLIRANRDLGLAFQLAGVGSVEATYVSATINALATALPDQPTDLIVPIRLWERPSDSVDNADWELMTQHEWAGDAVPEDKLLYWQYRGDAVLFLGATAAKKCKVSYYKTLGTITGPSSQISSPNAEHFLAAKTASYAARFVGKNVTLGSELNGEAQQALDLLLGIRVKEDQNVVMRMKPYRMNARR